MNASRSIVNIFSSVSDRAQCCSSAEDDGLRCLGYAIVAQAVKDWQAAKEDIELVSPKIEKLRSEMDQIVSAEEFDRTMEKLKELEKRKRSDRGMMNDCERFFKSQWFSSITEDVDGDVVLERLQRMDSSKRNKKSMKRFLNQEAIA